MNFLQRISGESVLGGLLSSPSRGGTHHYAGNFLLQSPRYSTVFPPWLWPISWLDHHIRRFLRPLQGTSNYIFISQKIFTEIIGIALTATISYGLLPDPPGNFCVFRPVDHDRRNTLGNSAGALGHRPTDGSSAERCLAATGSAGAATTQNVRRMAGNGTPHSPAVEFAAHLAKQLCQGMQTTYCIY